MHDDDNYIMRRGDGKYEQALNRHYEAWQYQESLAKVCFTYFPRASFRILITLQIASGSRTIYNFADAYGRCAAEEQGPASQMPTRLPSEREVGDMLNMAEWMKGMLDNLRGMVQASMVINDRAREASRGKGPAYEDEDMGMYGDGIKSAYEMGGVKKRRGVSTGSDISFLSSDRWAVILLTFGTSARGSSWSVSQLQPNRHA